MGSGAYVGSTLSYMGIAETSSEIEYMEGAEEELEGESGCLRNEKLRNEKGEEGEKVLNETW